MILCLLKYIKCQEVHKLCRFQVANKGEREKERKWETEKLELMVSPSVNGHDLGQTQGDGERQGSLVCYNLGLWTVRHDLATEQQQQQR